MYLEQPEDHPVSMINLQDPFTRLYWISKQFDIVGWVSRGGEVLLFVCNDDNLFNQYSFGGWSYWMGSTNEERRTRGRSGRMATVWYWCFSEFVKDVWLLSIKRNTWTWNRTWAWWWVVYHSFLFDSFCFQMKKKDNKYMTLTIDRTSMIE